MIEKWDDEIKADARRFCSNCGAELVAGARFCAKCGQAVGVPIRPAPAAQAVAATPAAATAPAVAPPAASMGNVSTIITIAGIAWIGVGLLDGYLAYVQWSLLPYAAGDLAGQLQTNALLNAGSALVTLFFAAWILSSPTRGRVFGSFVWGALSVLLVLGQLAGNPNIAWVIPVSGLLAAVAAALSFVAQRQMPSTSA